MTLKPVLDQISNQITIQTINEEYQNLRFPKSNIYQKHTGKVTDYNELVDGIIELAPPY